MNLYKSDYLELLINFIARGKRIQEYKITKQDFLY